MRAILILTFIIISNIAQSQQKKTEMIMEKQILTLKCEYFKIIDMEKLDTSTYVSMTFQNKKYDYIIDYGSIWLNAESGSLEVYELIKDLKSAQNEATAKNDVRWDRKNYQLFLSSNFKTLFINDKDGEYTTIPVKYLPTLIEWLNSAWMKIIEFEG
jgi:hypothetical protein